MNLIPPEQEDRPPTSPAPRGFPFVNDILDFFRTLTLRRLLRWSLVGLLLYLIYWLLQQANSALVPFIAGIVLAYLLLPLVNRLEERMPRWGAILVVYLVGLILLSSILGYIVPLLVDQVSQLLSLIPNVQQIELQANNLLDLYQRTIANLPPALRESLETALNQAFSTAQTNVADWVRNAGTFLLNGLIQLVVTVTTTVGFLLGFVLVPFWLFYVMMDERAGREALNRLLPRPIRTDFWTVATILDQVLSSYVRGQILLGVVVGTAAGVGLLILGLLGFEVNYILLLAVVAGITEMIPVIGPIIGAIPAILLGLTDGLGTGVAVTLLYILIQQLENNFLVPRIVGESVDIHPAVLMVLLVVCSQVFGLLGAILSAPGAAVVRDVFIYLYGRLSEPPQPAGLLPARLRKQVDAAAAPRSASTPPEPGASAEEPQPPASPPGDGTTPSTKK